MSGRAVVLGLLLFAAALTVVAYLGRPRISLRVQTPERAPRLAVIPFRNLSGEPELEVMCADSTEAVAKAVGASGRARIVPREETLGLTFDRAGIEEAARGLEADYVIAGSLDESEGEIVVDAYLFRAGPAPALWVDRLTWKASDRSSIAADLAVRVGSAIRAASP
jgi:TolB-like protein